MPTIGGYMLAQFLGVLLGGYCFASNPIKQGNLDGMHAVAQVANLGQFAQTSIRY
jgi:hypothetical protein